MPPGGVLLNGEDVSGLIGAPEVSRGASLVSAHRAVWLTLVTVQRAAADGRDMVCDGRDQGSFVFPAAEAKFFLVGTARVRAERRAAELAAQGKAVCVDDVMRDQDERDRRDAERELAPMAPASDAVIIDTTHLTSREVIERVENVVRDLRACRDSTARRNARHG